MNAATPTTSLAGRWLDRIEALGNKLPEPILLFASLAIMIIALSGIGRAAGWSVQPVKVVPVAAAAASERRTELVPQGEPIAVRSLMTRDGVYWLLSNMVHNFINFPPLGLVVTSMLGIGLAEKVGLFSALMRYLASITPRRLLTPMVIFIGGNAAIASDAGYIILPPLAAGLFAAMGRSPVAGIAAAFAGVAGGFGVGFFITGADTVLAGVASNAAHLIDEKASVLATTNWYFKIGSVLILTLAGWFVTERIIEPRLQKTGAGGTVPEGEKIGQFITPIVRRALLLAMLTMGVMIAVFLGLILVPGAPLHGDASIGTPARTVARWSQIIIPMMFFTFLAPGIVFGIATGVLRSQRDFCEGFYHAIKAIAPVIAMAFFAAQFIEYFKYSNLDRMLAYAGGKALWSIDLPTPLLLVLFVLLIILADFAMSSMTAKFTALAPIIIPMFMMVGLSPDLTIAAYRIGDSVVNIVSPLNSYMLIVLIVLQKYRKDAGLGTLIALMTPYSLIYTLVWIGFLLIWVWLGWPTGPGASLWYGHHG